MSGDYKASDPPEEVAGFALFRWSGEPYTGTYAHIQDVARKVRVAAESAFLDGFRAGWKAAMGRPTTEGGRR